MLTQLFRDARRFISSWWRQDRIRASSRDGRLLRIRPGDLLTIGPANVEVLSRSVTAATGLRLLELKCDSDSGLVVVYVTINPDEREQKVVWNESGRCREYHPDDVHVWSRSDHA